MVDRPRLGEILVRNQAITPEQLEEALAVQQETKQLLGQILLAKKYCTFEHLVDALTEQGTSLLSEE